MRDDFERLNRDADALAFLTVLRLSHGARQDSFALDARAMRRDGLVAGWGRDKYMAVTRKLLESGDLVLVEQGGRSLRDPSLYRLSQ